MMNFRKKRRGVSVVISVLLILAITTIGALFVSNLIRTSDITTISETSVSDLSVNSIKLTSYDTRDGGTLTAITSLNNQHDDILCTTTCAGTPNNIPSSGGTEFVVIQIRNKNVNSIVIHDIKVNGISHTWDSQTSGVIFDATFNDITGKYPQNSKFSIIPTSNAVTLTQMSDHTLNGDEEARLVIKLSKDFPADIELGKPIQVFVNSGSNQLTKYIILTGDTK